MRLWKYIDYYIGQPAYCVDYEDRMSFLHIHRTSDGRLSCGYLDRNIDVEEPSRQGCYETSFLDILVTFDISEQELLEVKEKRMDAIEAAKFLMGQTNNY